MKNFLKTQILFFVLILLLPGCVKLALQFTPSLIPNFTETIFEECDSELAKNAIPANLKLLEGLLKNDSDNKKILTALAMGFSGYSMLFVESEDTERASGLYLRARDYGIRALGDKGPALINPEVPREDLQNILKTIGKEGLKPLIWTTVSWNAWINLNLDKPMALAQLGLTQACLERIIEIDAHYMHGLPYILMGISLAARPPMFGGNPEQAKLFFEKAMALSQNKFFFAQYYFARYYAVRVQDKRLFLRLVDDIIKGRPQDLRDVCLINTVTQHKVRELAKKMDELFI
ncbi:MAG: TRAP transporter TatT component family protein [Pseudomonadota bacterium]